ncbi:MAG: uridylate kinase, partial [Methanothrix sp.]|nr:uridylate kinase [Methanothrix sp.]
AMEQYAYFLADGTGVALTSEVRPPQDEGSLEILLPYQALLEDDSGDVDGVIIDGRVAKELPASILLGRESCIDQGTVRLLCGRLKGMKVMVLNGTDIDRFIKSLREGIAGTIITG